jgi:hypothetical protein
MNGLLAQFEALRLAFGRLTQREQMMVVAGGALAVLVILTGVGLLVSNAITKAERRVKIKTEGLAEIMELQGEYKARQAVQERRLRDLKSTSNVRLVKLVEDAERSSGVDIGQLNPDQSPPNADGVVESRVDLRASNLSVDRLQDFLNKLEGSPGAVVIRRLKVNKPYRKDTLNVELTVTSYTVKSNDEGK